MEKRVEVRMGVVVLWCYGITVYCNIILDFLARRIVVLCCGVMGLGVNINEE
jgi:hypothetical protein